MSTKAVAVWLAIAVVLGGLAIYLLTSSGPGSGTGKATTATPGQKLIEFAPTDVTSITVNAPDRAAETIRRSPDNAQWVIVLAPVSMPGMPTAPTNSGGGSGIAAAGRAWPLVDSRIQSFLTILGETRVVSAPAADAQLGLSPTVLTLASGSGRVIQIELADRTVGGTGLARVSLSNPGLPRDTKPKPMLAVIDDRLHQILRSPGPRTWRDQTALPMAKSDVSRIAMESSGRELEIGRVDGRWSVRKPYSAPADATAVERLTRALSQVSIIDFLDAGPGTAATGLSQPTASIRLEHDRRQVDPNGGAIATTDKAELIVGSIGGLGSAGADRVFARIDTDRVVLIDGKALADLQMDPGAFVWPHPSTASPTDVGTMLMEVRGTVADTPTATSEDDRSASPRLLRRELDRWVSVAADGSTSPMVETQIADVNRALSFLTGKGNESGPGAAHIGSQPPGRFVPFGRVALLSVGSAQIEEIQIGEAGRGLVSFRTGDVYRTYPEDRLPRLLAELRGRAKAAGVPIDGFGATGPEGRDRVK